MYKNLYYKLLEKIFIQNPDIKKVHDEVFNILNSTQLAKPEKLECILSLSNNFVTLDKYTFVIYNDLFDYNVNHLAKKVFMTKKIGNISLEVTDDLLSFRHNGAEFNYYYDSENGTNYFQSNELLIQLESNSLKFFIENSNTIVEEDILDFVKLNYDVDLNKSIAFKSIKNTLVISMNYIDEVIESKKNTLRSIKSTI